MGGGIAGRIVGFVAAVLLLGWMLALGVAGWFTLYSVPLHSRDLRKVEVDATVRDDGSMLLRTTYRFSRPLPEVRVLGPNGATGPLVLDNPGQDATFEWTVPDSLVKRFDDGGVVVTVPLVQLLSTVARGRVDVALAVHGTAAGAERVATNLHGTSWANQDGVVTVRGQGDADGLSEAVLLLAPGPTAQDAFVWFGSSTDHFRSIDPAHQHRDPVERAGLWVRRVALLGYTAITLWLVGRWVWGLVTALRRRAGAKLDARTERDEPPGAPPAMTGLLAGQSGRGGRSLVAATVLDMAERGAIEIDGVTSEAFVLRVPADEQGSTRTEAKVLEALRAQAHAEAGKALELQGPPLWTSPAKSLVRAHRSALRREAADAGYLTELVAPMELFLLPIPAGLLAMFVAANIGVGFLLLAIGPWLGVIAALLAGTMLTGTGRQVRIEGEAYARHLRAATALTDVGAPGVVVWGRALAYAAALGAAPHAAAALAPSGETTRLHV